MKKKVKSLVPNLMGSNEVKEVIAKYPDAKFPETIPFHNRKHYNFMGATLVKTGGIDSELKIKTFTMDPVQYEGMSDTQKTEMSGKYGKLMIIHNPTLTQEDEVEVEELEDEVAPIVLKKKKAKKKVTGRLTDAKEKKIAKEFEQLLEGIEEDEELVIEGAWISELSERHNVPVDKLKEYLEKLATQEDEDEVEVEDPTPVVE